jgi:hypothetical protein
MSNISPDFIHSVEFLYEEINVHNQDFLNEDSEYYDAEMSYLVEDILSTISTSMIYEGYSASAIIGFLADSSTQDILEKYLTFDENILLENTIPEEYIQEQLKIFDYCIDEGLGSLIGKVAKGAAGLAGRIASKPARSAAAKKLATSANPEKTRAAMQRLAQREARKGNVGGYSKTQSPIDGGKPMSGKQSAELLTKAKIGQVTQKVKDIATKAKPVLQKVGKGVGIFGLGAAGGYVGAKMAGAGSKPSESPKPTSTPPAALEAPKPPAAPAKPSGGSPAPASPKPKADQGTSKYKELIKQGKTKEAEKLGLETWAKANPKLAAKLNADGTQKGTGQSEMEKDAEELRKMQNKSKQRQGALMGGSEGPGKVDTKAADDALKAELERQKKRMEQQKTTAPVKESHEPYDIILNYLLSEGHADTVDEANYIMLEMDTDSIGKIMQEYYDYVLAEEIQGWVNELIEEGYDLSEYTWDDVVEYYVTEAKYGTAKGRKKLAKKVRAGKDVGKKGAGFEEIVKKASGEYGKERATKIAAAAMWKNLGK